MLKRSIKKVKANQRALIAAYGHCDFRWSTDRLSMRSQVALYLRMNRCDCSSGLRAQTSSDPGSWYL